MTHSNARPDFTIDTLRLYCKDEGDCWIWQGVSTIDGYGTIGYGGRNIGTHRLAYILAHGLTRAELPSEVLIRHTCDRPPCCNPAHLLPGTHMDNYLDMIERGRGWPMKTHCPQGHPYDEANTRIDKNGHRCCRDCGIARCKAWKKKTGYSRRARK